MLLLTSLLFFRLFLKQQYVSEEPSLIVKCVRMADQDSDPYTISYEASSFSAYDSNQECSMADLWPDGGPGNEWGYDSGARTGQCGFSC